MFPVITVFYSRQTLEIDLWVRHVKQIIGLHFLPYWVLGKQHYTSTLPFKIHLLIWI